MLPHDDDHDKEETAATQTAELSDVEEILLATDINALTPIAAFKLVMELKDKVKEEHE